MSSSRDAAVALEPRTLWQRTARWPQSAGSRLRRVTRSRLAGNTLATATGTAGRLLLQIVLFIIVARLLGPGDYGAFVSVTALVAIVSTLAGLACEAVMVKNTARDRSAFAAAFGHGLILLGATAIPLTALCVLAADLIGAATLDWRLVVVIALGDLFFLRVNLFCAACYQAHERVGKSALLNVGFSGARLAAAIVAALAAAPLDIHSWALFYAGSAVIAAIASLAMVIRDLGWPRWTVLTDDIRFGLHSSLQSTLYFTLRDIDKPLLARLASLEAAGIYAAAFRVADAAIVPIRSLMYAAYASFFRHGAGGASRSAEFALRLLPYGLAYGVIAAIGLALAPYVLPWILGHDYAAAGDVLLVLAALPFLHAAYNIGADALTASGLQSARSVAHLVGAAFMVTGCVVLIPSYGAAGAAFANLGSHAVLATLTWSLLGWHRTTQRRGADRPPSNARSNKGEQP